ncbi:hypothetical protein GGR57DRAFT_269731 [Xylariaceae sp. FL1272]|nr:hypothetical protein GGR57DRAFT_269731 [Xylariaceae sp. FL1272]
MDGKITQHSPVPGTIASLTLCKGNKMVTVGFPAVAQDTILTAIQPLAKKWFGGISERRRSPETMEIKLRRNIWNVHGSHALGSLAPAVSLHNVFARLSWLGWRFVERASFGKRDDDDECYLFQYFAPSSFKEGGEVMLVSTYGKDKLVLHSAPEQTIVVMTEAFDHIGTSERNGRSHVLQIMGKPWDNAKKRRELKLQSTNTVLQTLRNQGWELYWTFSSHHKCWTREYGDIWSFQRSKPDSVVSAAEGPKEAGEEKPPAYVSATADRSNTPQKRDAIES